MIINGKSLLRAAPIVDMIPHKVQGTPTSYGTTECGYDIRIKQNIEYLAGCDVIRVTEPDGTIKYIDGRFVLGSSIEKFQMPNNLMGRIMNKSTWARLGVDAARGTNAEPGWNGHLTIELTFDGGKDIHIPAGSGILQVIFETLAEPAQYVGRYQSQGDHPTEAQLSLPL